MTLQGNRVSLLSICVWLGAGILSLPLCGQALALDVKTTDAPYVFGYAKAMYVADDKKGGRPNQSTLGLGGKIGGATASFNGLRLKGALYTTTDLGLRKDNPRQTDAYMFDLDKKPYSQLGEAQVEYAAGSSRLTIGRQEFFSPIINTYDYRIIPNLYEAATFVNRDLADTTLTFAYVSRMSGLDGLVSFSEFRSMSQQAYTSLLVTPDGKADARRGDTLDPSTVVGHRGVWVAGAVYEGAMKLRLWYYHGTELLDNLYVDGQIKTPLSRDLTATVDVQAYRVADIGHFRKYLMQQGLDARYGLGGIKATLAHGPSGMSVALAANRFSGTQRTVTAYGNWGGYPEFVLMPYMYAENAGVSAIAGAAMVRLTLLADLGRYGFPDHSLLFGHARINIDESILTGADTRVNSVLYRAKLSPQLSVRLALDARQSGNPRYDNEFVAMSLRYDF